MAIARNGAEFGVRIGIVNNEMQRGEEYYKYYPGVENPDPDLAGKTRFIEERQCREFTAAHIGNGAFVVAVADVAPQRVLACRRIDSVENIIEFNGWEFIAGSTGPCSFTHGS